MLILVSAIGHKYEALIEDYDGFHLFNDISTFVDYFMPKPSLEKDSSVI